MNDEMGDELDENPSARRYEMIGQLGDRSCRIMLIWLAQKHPDLFDEAVGGRTRIRAGV